jgi:putative ABC transport system permease protein
LILLAFIVGSAIAFFAMTLWLNEFAYHINIHWIHFLVAGIFFLIVTLGTVGFKSLKAANKNPADTLRTE